MNALEHYFKVYMKVEAANAAVIEAAKNQHANLVPMEAWIQAANKTDHAVTRLLELEKELTVAASKINLTQMTKTF